MLLILGLFLFASILLFTRKVLGYWLMVIFLTIEFLFYLSNVLVEVIHGAGLLYYLNNPNLLLRVVFAIGYLNLLASGYFLGLLLLKRAYFLGSHSAPGKGDASGSRGSSTRPARRLDS